MIKKILSRFEIKLPLLITICFSILYLIILFINHYHFRTFSFDYGFYNNAFYDFAHFRMNDASLFDPSKESFFSVHLTLTLIILSPLYWILNPIFGTYSLFVIMVTFIAIGGYYVHKIILFKSNDKFISLLALLHYFLLHGHFCSLTSDYSDTIVASSMVPLIYYFFTTKKYLLSSIIFLFILFTKENMALWLIFICIVLIIDHRKEKKQVLLAIYYILFSLAYFIISFTFLIPFIEKTYQISYDHFAYSAIGNSMPEAIKFIITKPFEAIKLLFINHTDNSQYDLLKIEFFYVYIISGGFILFKKPQYIIWFIPLLAQKMYNDSFVRWGIIAYYSIEVVSLLSISVFLSFIHLKSIQYKKQLGVLIIILTATITIIKLQKTDLTWYDTSKENFLNSIFYKSELDLKRIKSNLSIIPDEAIVSASNNLVPHLAFRDKVFHFPVVRDADFIVLLSYGSNYPLSESDFELQKNKFSYDNDNWIIIIDEFPLLILKKNNGNFPNIKPLEQLIETIKCNAEIISDDNRYYLSENGSYYFDNINTRSNENPYEGDYCIKLDSLNKYGSTLILHKLNNITNIRATAMIKGNAIIVCSNLNGTFYFHTDTIHSNEYMQHELNVGNINSSDTLKIYLLNVSNENTYADNLKINISRKITPISND